MSADWPPPHYHKTARMVPQLFQEPQSMSKLGPNDSTIKSFVQNV